MGNSVLKNPARNPKYSREKIIKILSLKDQNEIDQLCSCANLIRKNYCGDEVHLRGIIEFSNYCYRNCLYCGLRNDNKILKRYRMTQEEIVQATKSLVECGIKTVVLQSGEDAFFTVDMIEDLICELKNRYAIAVTLSIGERPYEHYERWFKAGADRYLLKHETIDPKLYSKLHPDMKYSNRINCLETLRSIGYQVGSGNIIGLPEQSLQTIADDILFLKKMNIDMAGIGPFIPHPNTPLSKHPVGDAQLVFKTLAVTRIVLKDTHLPVTTSLQVLDSDGLENGLRCGANVIMPNFTPSPFREFYEIYPEKNAKIFSAKNTVFKIKERVKKIGRIISSGEGHSLKFKKLKTSIL
jgi:biotin synthase